jgi:hypothetical protein
MNWQEALRARLAGDAGVAAITTQVSWVLRPQHAAMPAITLQTIDQDREQHMAGFQELQRALVQIDVWSLDYARQVALREAVIAALVPAQSGNGIAFRRAFVRWRETIEDTETAPVHRAIMDFTLSYSAQ